MLTQTPINTNTNSITARAARTSSLVRQIQQTTRKAARGSICAQLDDKSHKGRGRFKPGMLTKIVKDLKGEQCATRTEKKMQW